jgi:glycerol-3-phosphate dehydrogenase
MPLTQAVNAVVNLGASPLEQVDILMHRQIKAE